MLVTPPPPARTPRLPKHSVECLEKAAPDVFTHYRGRAFTTSLAAKTQQGQEGNKHCFGSDFYRQADFQHAVTSLGAGFRACLGRRQKTKSNTTHKQGRPPGRPALRWDVVTPAASPAKEPAGRPRRQSSMLPSLPACAISAACPDRAQSRRR